MITDKEIEYCYKCGVDAITDEGGIIYVRAKNKVGKWSSLAICPRCWNKENPEKQYKPEMYS